MNKVDGRRISAAEAYLTAAVRARPNFTLRAETLRAPRALRAASARSGSRSRARSGIERIEASSVILCAGAINTPGILLRSGVGPDREVRRLKCEPVLDAPAVARRLLDHPGTGIFVLGRALWGGLRAPDHADRVSLLVRRLQSPRGHAAAAGVVHDVPGQAAAVRPGHAGR